MPTGGRDTRSPLAFLVTLMFLLGLAVPYTAGAGELDYQPRGSYWEGVKEKPVSGFGLELISARAEYQDRPDRIGSEYRARFFLNKPAPVCLVVRERDNTKYYWLDRANPPEPWKAGVPNEFSWPTRTVIESLGLKLYDLGIVVRIDCGQPSAEERIAPAVLYQTQAPKAITGYFFTFKRGDGMNLKARIFPESGREPVYEEDLGALPGPGVFDVVWPSKNRPAGDYTLVLEGYDLSNNAPVYQAVHFHHRPSLE